ncbi:MAG: ABC transporter permease, partial [Candidatus Acidiferrales bacterium]
QETQIINQIIWTGFLFLSGATIPLAKFPAWIQRVSLFIPATYMATGLQDAANNFASWGEVITDLAALALGTYVAFEISRQLFRWEPEAKVPGRAKLLVLAALVPFLIFGAYENFSGSRLQQIERNFDMLSHQIAMPQMPRMP